jgi:nicotinate phosphoribosyltransferase
VEAQLFETFILNQIYSESVLAKAWWVVSAAQGRVVVDFGSLQLHRTDAALKFARATYLAGEHGTSNVLGGRKYDLSPRNSECKKVHLVQRL